ncbi:MAG: FHA domain-containing protein [Burkholderiales bacterium]
MHAFVVLKPLSHPELSEIRIGKLFTIGRTEQPFATYARDVIIDLSRQHARIFCVDGAVYLADLGSKNGTTVNRNIIRTEPHPLQDGDEICFGGGLSYRAELSSRPNLPSDAPKILAVILTPERSDLHSIVVNRFPFLIGKTDEAFSRYRQEKSAQLHFLSRRHAHVFLKDGLPFIEDLGSTNGTFVGGKRLGEQAVPLEDSTLLAFGGDHFAYRVHLDMAPRQEPASANPDADVTIAAAAMEPVQPDRTTFVAAAGSFLEIFYLDHAEKQPVEGAKEDVKPSAEPVQESGRERGKFATFRSELRLAFGGAERKAHGRTFWLGASGAIALALIVLGLYLWGASERELKDLLADGAYAKAATLASEQLQRDPDNAELKALATEAILKAHVPAWLNKLNARDFDAAKAVLADMNTLGRHHADVGSLVRGLEWIGDLESLIVGRGGVDAPIRIYVDEENIRSILKRWDDDGHQRALARIASHVQEFKGPHAEALTHLRKLQSDSLVYLAAIDRLKVVISADLNRDAPESLQTVLKEYAEKYPRLGLEAVRQDLRQYIDVESQARARNLSRLVLLQGKVRFATPPFEDKYRTLKESNRIPPVEIAEQYDAVSKAWREGNSKQALLGLEKMAAGAWADAAAREIARKKTIMEQFSALQKARGAAGYNERLLALHGALDPDEDSYFVRAIEADVGLHKDSAIARAQELLNRAQGQWQRYRENGVIEGRQRLESEVSNRFRTQALLLSEAHELAQNGMRIYTQLRLAHPAQWNKIHQEIKVEAELQRTSLLELRNVLAPGLLKAKLALLGGRSDD